MTTLGEAILIVPAKLLKGVVNAKEVEVLIDVAANEHEAQNEDNAPTVQDGVDNALESTADDIQVSDGNQRLRIGDGGVRVETGADEDEEDEENGVSGVNADKKSLKKKNKKRRAGECNAHEARFLTAFATTTKCRRIVWDVFFKNRSKRTEFGFLLVCFSC